MPNGNTIVLCGQNRQLAFKGSVVTWEAITRYYSLTSDLRVLETRLHEHYLSTSWVVNQWNMVPIRSMQSSHAVD